MEEHVLLSVRIKMDEGIESWCSLFICLFVCFILLHFPSSRKNKNICLCCFPKQLFEKHQSPVRARKSVFLSV